MDLDLQALNHTLHATLQPSTLPCNLTRYLAGPEPHLHQSAAGFGHQGGQSISNLQFEHRAPFGQMACKQNLDLRCVLISDPGTLGAGAKARLESRIKEFTPHCVCRASTAPFACFSTYIIITINPLLTDSIITPLPLFKMVPIYIYIYIYIFETQC